MKKWLCSLIFFISTSSFAFPQLVAGGVSTWTNSGLMAGGFYSASATNPVILTVMGGGVVGLGTAKLMNNYWYSNCENELACEIAKLNTYAGAVAGIIITTVLTSSSLAVGMTGGVLVGTVVAVPILTAVVAGGMSYWWFESS
ncbi:hypothetical protein QUF74_15290 [Candidatus Halobeggiatoa sp. HSG11]|nr:hypothetical protein [Candidatus Halobeggiatoa sp. HSG11]